MEFLDFNLDIIHYICEKLTPVDMAMLSSTCTSLYSYYPHSMRHRKLMKPVFININNLDYKFWRDDDGTSSRKVGDAQVIYRHVRELTRPYENLLHVTYRFPKIPLFESGEAVECSFNGGYPNIDKFRKFQTFIDRTMWYCQFNGCNFQGIQRRGLPGSVRLRIEINCYTHAQEITLTDQEVINPYVEIKYLPPWADKS